MKNLHSELLSWIAENQVTVDALHEHIHKQLGERYEIGEAGMDINEMIAKGVINIETTGKVVYNALFYDRKDE